MYRPWSLFLIILGILFFQLASASSLRSEGRRALESADTVRILLGEGTDREVPASVESFSLRTTESSDSVEIPHSEPKRGVAIALTVLLGPLGGHRLYLGTDPKVPVLYTVTLGGGLGLLPLIDLVQLILTDDLDKFKNHSKVFLWQKKDSKE